MYFQKHLLRFVVFLCTISISFLSFFPFVFCSERLEADGTFVRLFAFMKSILLRLIGHAKRTFLFIEIKMN